MARRWFGTLAALLVLTASAGALAKGPAKRTVEPRVALFLRSDPSLAAKVLQRLPGWSRVTTSGRSADGDWTRVTVGGARGWVRTQDLKVGMVAATDQVTE